MPLKWRTGCARADEKDVPLLDHTRRAEEKCRPSGALATREQGKIDLSCSITHAVQRRDAAKEAHRLRGEQGEEREKEDGDAGIA